MPGYDGFLFSESPEEFRIGNAIFCHSRETEKLP
jgi:hypothetical protein